MRSMKQKQNNSKNANILQQFFSLTITAYFHLLSFHMIVYTHSHSHLASFFLLSLYIVSKGLVNTHTIPTLRKMLGQNRRLRKENKCSKNTCIKLLQSIHQLITSIIWGTSPLTQMKKRYLTKVLASYVPLKWFRKQKYGKPFSNSKDRCSYTTTFISNQTKTKILKFSN